MSTAATLTPTDLKVAEIFSDADFNCRGQISPYDVRELAQDIEANGLQNPITVEPYTGMAGYKYRILAGHRRFAAFQALSRQTIPAVTKTHMTETDAILFNLTENINRENLNPLQEARAIKRLYDKGWSVQEVSKAVNKSTGWVKTRFDLLDMPDEIQNDVAYGFLRIEDIKKISKEASIEQQFSLAKQLKDAKFKNLKKEPKEVKNKKHARQREEINAIQQLLSQLFGFSITTRVLAWAQGEIDDVDLHESIKEEADAMRIPYAIPLYLRKKEDAVTR